MASTNYHIRPYHHDDINSIVRLMANKKNHPNKYFKSKSHSWNWQYYQNPHKTTSVPLGFIAEKDKNVIGSLLIMPNRIIANNTDSIIYWGNDLIVDQVFRKSGIGSTLIKKWERIGDFQAAFNTSDASFNLFYQRNWYKTKNIKEGFFIAKPRKFTWKELFKSIYCRTRLFSATNRHGSDLEINHCNRIPADYSTLWKDITGEIRYTVNKDHEYLAWKYIQHPSLSYKIFEARRKSRLEGLIIFRVAERNNIKVGFISELIARPSQSIVFLHILYVALQMLIKKGASSIRCVSSHKTFDSYIRKIGFFWNNYPPNFFTHCLANSSLEKLIYHDNWLLSGGDSDYDFSFDY